MDNYPKGFESTDDEKSRIKKEIEVLRLQISNQTGIVDDIKRDLDSQIGYMYNEKTAMRLEYRLFDARSKLEDLKKVLREKERQFANINLR